MQTVYAVTDYGHDVNAIYESKDAAEEACRLSGSPGLEIVEYQLLPKPTEDQAPTRYNVSTTSGSEINVWTYRIDPWRSADDEFGTMVFALPKRESRRDETTNELVFYETGEIEFEARGFESEEAAVEALMKLRANHPSTVKA